MFEGVVVGAHLKNQELVFGGFAPQLGLLGDGDVALVLELHARVNDLDVDFGLNGLLKWALFALVV